MEEKCCLFCNQISYSASTLSWFCPYCSGENENDDGKVEEEDDEKLLGFLRLKPENNQWDLITSILSYANQILKPRKLKFELTSVSETNYILIIKGRQHSEN
ncbi:MAG: hypothetical protein M0Z31_15765 [Clostridia bacterium]|nr:hypothetical protein [Clostridia bacterium]